MAEMNLEQRQYLTARFEEFVAVVHPSGDDQPVRKPYQWQIRLMLYVAGHGHWPQGIGAPTASGKTCVIDIHVFLNAMAGLVSAEGSAESQKLAGVPLQRIPRRLALTVNRRSLVDDQFDEASALQKRIQAENNENDKLDIYRKGLDLRSAINDGLQPESPSPRMIAVELRGGVSPDREWRYYPQTCAVICATPDMFGSRLLFRGYGTSRTMRSMEAGLLAYDTVLIVDEAHLSRQLLKTALATVEHLAAEPEQNNGLYRWALDRLENYLQKRLTRRLAAAASQIGALQKLEDKLLSGRSSPSSFHGMLDVGGGTSLGRVRGATAL